MQEVDFDVTGRKFIMDAKLIHNTMAIAQAGNARVAGLINMVKDKNGTVFPTFFTGHAARPVPTIFMEEPRGLDRVRFELTGKTFEQMWAENDDELGVYASFAAQVFAANLPKDSFDGYATMNAALWMKDSGFFKPAAFLANAAPLDGETVQRAIAVCMASFKVMEDFIAEARKAAEEVVRH